MNTREGPSQFGRESLVLISRVMKLRL
jgi:hypothetical protein